jgi:hypothetical protein
LGKGSNTTTSTTSSSPDPQAAALYRDLLTRAQSVASTPYQAYTGDLTADVNSQQNAGISGINAAAGYANPYIQNASGLAAAATAPITGQTIQQYQNPYTQQVVDATTAQMRNDFGQQQAALQGNQIAQGALGGNATGVAKGILAGQQGRTMASTVAGLYDKSYQQALQAAQQQQQTGLAGANAQAQYGLSGQNAALTGATAQIGAGTLQQQTEQANLNALYQQYQQAQAYPYQQTQWLAGLGTGVGSNLGGTGTGSTTGPAPNQTGQWLGAGLSAASLFLSDARAKEDIEHIGSLNDGQKIYRYRYKGQPGIHIGLIAQEAEQHNPESVHKGVGGVRFVDMDEATEGAVRRADGGGVSATPWGGGVGWIPQMQIHAGAGAPRGTAPSLPSQQNAFDPEKAAKSIVGIGKGLGGLDWGGGFSAGLGNLSGDSWGGGSMRLGDAYGGSSAQPLAGLDASDYGPGFAAGGPVISDGGYNDLDAQADLYGDGSFNAIDAEAGLTPADEYNFIDHQGNPDPFGDTNRVIAHDNVRRGDGIYSPPELPVFDESGRMMGNQTSAQGVAAAPPDTPVVAASDEEGPAGPAPTDTSARSRGLGSAGLPPEAYYGRPDAVRPREDDRGFGLGLLSKNAQTGLLAAGLGMLASRSPFLGNMVGEGGLAGVGAYGRAEEHDRQVAAEAEKLSREARKDFLKTSLDYRKQDETERHNQATERAAASGRDRLPPGMRLNDKGVAELIPGVDKAAERLAQSRRPPAAASMDDETAEFLANRVLAGDTKALVGLGRGAQGAENLAKINGIVARLAKSGEPVNAAAREILQNAAQQQGLIAAERTQAQIMAKLSVYGRTAFRATDIALRLSDEVPRTKWQPINKVLNAAKTKTGDPNIVAFGQALQTLSNEYARAIGGGHGTVHMQEQAEKRLNEAQSPEQLKAIIQVMRQEIVAEEGAMPEAREHIRSIYNPRPGQVGHSIAGERGMAAPNGPVPGASGFKPPAGALPGKPDKNGKVWYYDPVTKQPYPGQ